MQYLFRTLLNFYLLYLDNVRIIFSGTEKGNRSILSTHGKIQINFLLFQSAD